jgi:hypothetical protein
MPVNDGGTVAGRPSRGRSAAGPVAQWLEPAAHNGLVAGSSPAGPTNESIIIIAWSVYFIAPLSLRSRAAIKASEDEVIRPQMRRANDHTEVGHVIAVDVG